ncbi:MAG: hypothetical protein NC205_00045 [Prevotella sp.]|nr:hypothetical protein [Alistipes senegalensis]MCM1356954.1 hypothetical protein [Prevotella sp.]MCM1472436.1 hypothetical protein [Muribaculaceae bacterium]
MKKIPAHTTLLFVLALMPAVVFVVFLIIGIIYGDIEEVIGGFFLIVPVIFCFKRGINPDILSIPAFIIPVLQIVTVINYIIARKKVREYKESQPDNEDYESIL